MEFSIQIVARTLKFFANNTEIFTLDLFGTETLGLSTMASSMAWMFASIHVAITGMMIGQASQGIYGWLGLPGFIGAEIAVLVTAIALSSALIGDSISVEEANQVFAMYASLFLDAVLISEFLALLTGSGTLKKLKSLGTIAFLVAIEGADGGVFFLPQKDYDPFLKGMFW
ncbi:MAG: hypothetical protein D6732_21295, partial [Methanobacteriota archaeon]